LALSASVVGLALAASAEPLGAAMVRRHLDAILARAPPAARRAVPVAAALLHASDPQLPVTELLSRLARDHDQAVATAACAALGVASAGSNHARVAGQLRGLAQWHARSPAPLFAVRVSQGLVHLGKGLLTLSPLHRAGAGPGAGGLRAAPAQAALLAALFPLLRARETLCGRYHGLWYALAPALQPRAFLPILWGEGRDLAAERAAKREGGEGGAGGARAVVRDAMGREVGAGGAVEGDGGKAPPPAAKKAGDLVRTPARVGEAAEAAAQAGRPARVAGAAVHQTPALLARGEAAELATGRYRPAAQGGRGAVLEGVVLVEENPAWTEDGAERHEHEL